MACLKIPPANQLIPGREPEATLARLLDGQKIAEEVDQPTEVALGGIRIVTDNRHVDLLHIVQTIDLVMEAAGDNVVVVISDHDVHVLRDAEAAIVHHQRTVEPGSTTMSPRM